MAECVTLEMAPACVNLTGVRAGDRNLLAVSVTIDGAPYNLTGLTITSQAREHAQDSTVAIDGVVTITDAVNGKLTVAWPGDDVATLMTGLTKSWKGVWDLQAQPATGDPITLLAGSFTADWDVTRP